MDKLKIAYIGGGSKMWARILMNDLALCKEMSGEICLYDIDIEAALRNKAIGEKINEHPSTLSKWDYSVTSSLEECLRRARFVVLSILPGTFEEMRADVHLPEKYGIWQTVGDTVGPGGVLRAMRTVPIYEYFARMIQKFAPEAWVINFTNPMSLCVRTLYDVFPGIKAFGCCHEVFHAQEFLALVAKEELKLDQKPSREEIRIDVTGINHLTWITKATYKGTDLFPLIPPFSKRHFEEGIYEGDDPMEFKHNSFAGGNKVKMDLFERYGVLAAAGDRHLVEFLNNSWYLKTREEIDKWAISLTTVDFRIDRMKEKVAESINMVNGLIPVEVHQSKEEATDLMKALLGYKDIVSNVNAPNFGQAEDLPLGSIVETNCLFSEDSIRPLRAKPLPTAVLNLVKRNAINNEVLYEGIRYRDFRQIFNAFVNQPLLSSLSVSEAKALFREMVRSTRKYLDEYYDVESFLEHF